MEKPLKENYHQDVTGESLMNGPYNQTRYAQDLEKYINHLESSQWNAAIETTEFFIKDWYENERALDGFDFYTELEKLKK